MSRNLKAMAPYLSIWLITFYLLPLLIKDTGSAMFMLLLVTPFIFLISGFFLGNRHGFRWFDPVILFFLGIPTLWIYYNESALIYFLIDPLLLMLGSYLGSLRRKKSSRDL